jgi:hypothetical protein
MLHFLKATLAIALLLASTASEAAGAITPGRYDCGPYRQQFRVISCDALRCNIYTYDPGARGGGFSSTMDVASLRTLLATGAPGGTACRMVGKGSAAGGAAPANPNASRRRAAIVAPGRYECYTFSGGHLYAAMSENFTILGGNTYRDWSGRSGTYSYGAGQIVFHGGALNGHRAVYKPGIPPLSRNPNNVTFLRPNGDLGDSCDGKV